MHLRLIHMHLSLIDFEIITSFILCAQYTEHPFFGFSRKRFRLALMLKKKVTGLDGPIADGQSTRSITRPKNSEGASREEKRRSEVTGPRGCLSRITPRRISQIANV